MSFSSMYIGATGIVAHNANMQVIANNLANVSTTGYKKADAQFSDLMSQQMATGSAQYEGNANYISQMGKGVAISEIRTVFAEGGLEDTGTVTDLAITGNGFFGTRNTSSQSASAGATHYTRAGAFRFNNDAYLVDANNYRLQGYAVDRDTGEVASSVSDIQLPYDDIVVNGMATRVVRSEPRATTAIEMVTNLDRLAESEYNSANNPFFSMLESYNANLSNASTPFGNSLPAYSSSVDVYDSEGNSHELTIYFDPVNTNAISNAAGGYTYWEYLIALPAESDGSAAYGTSAAGIAGLGVMTFNGQGELVNMASYSLGGTTSGAGAKDLSSWTPSTFSEDGIPQFSFTYGSNGSAVGSMEYVSYDFGISSDNSAWLSGAGTAAGIGTNVNNLVGLSGLNRDARVSTNFDAGSSTLYEIQDGYTSGYLQSTSVSRDGFLEGYFTNGQTEKLYQVAMYRFNSEWGLRRDGSTNFVATEASGSPIVSKAEEFGCGTINQNSLEQSNVDMAEEFAKMILTQRGFQANTKVITTSDGLLNTTIGIKR